MGEQDVVGKNEPALLREFTRSLLADLKALERIIAEDRIESGVRRFGAEQELFLVDQGWRPAPVSAAILEELADDRFTTEMGRFNLEINIPPMRIASGMLTGLEETLRTLVGRASDAAERHDSRVVMTGILPTIGNSDVSPENITPHPRYAALNEAVLALRGGKLRLRIAGTDELDIEHDSVMLEACTTSFQLHVQVSASEFRSFYNMAQAMLGPMLAASVNSPLLFGKRLWAETRIALFQQAVDVRSATPHIRELSPRVRFGDEWVREGVLELFEDDLARFRVLLAMQVEEESLRTLEDGGMPELAALQLHNSTVYRWNRPCYGVADGIPHLRIECRAIPAGPTVLDEVANAALWLGLLIGGVEQLGDVSEQMDFGDAKANFHAAARRGLHAGFTWVGGEPIAAGRLLLERLLPLARAGLEQAGMSASEIDRYLGVVEERVRSGRTGAEWLLRSADGLRGRGSRAERLAALTAATANRQREGSPVHEWEPARLEEAGGWRDNYLLVEQFMTTDLFTIHQEELVDLAVFLMERRRVRQILVEDDEHRLVGVVSHRSLLELLDLRESDAQEGGVAVREVMERDVASVAPDTPTLEAIRTMREHRVPVLPVLRHGRLVGVVSEWDLMPIAEKVMEEEAVEG
jgi:CBS domain-containing protein